MVAQSWGWGQEGWSAKGMKKSWGDGNVLYLDCGSGFTGFYICWAHQMVYSKYM